MGAAAEEARKYLSQKEVPQLFESLMTGLMYNKPEDPVEFMQKALTQIKKEPSRKVIWDMFIENPPATPDKNGLSPVAEEKKPTKTPPSSGKQNRVSSVHKNADKARIQQVPMILFIGGPGGGKSKYAEMACAALKSEGVVHISLPKLIKETLAKYKGKYSDWTAANKHYEAGELIPNELALALAKAEMGKHSDAKAFFLEGYPRELNQIREFEASVKKIEMALILDFDETTLRSQMKAKNVPDKLADARIQVFKSKSLPAAKFFDDKFLLHLIPGEQQDDAIMEEIKSLIKQALKGPVRTDTPALTGVNGDIPTGLPTDAPVILVIGAPGSQKEEYCKRIAKRYEGFVHLSMGELLRIRFNDNAHDPKWKSLLDSMNKGELIPSEICREILYKALHEHPKSWGFVFSGYPKTLEQAIDFERTVERIDMALLIDCTEQFCLKTLREQASAEDRADNGVDAVRARLDAFKQHTLPMLKYLDEKEKLKVVEGDKGVEEIFADVGNVIDSTLFIPQDSGSGKNSIE